jgi:hypothetical protein
MIPARGSAPFATALVLSVSAATVAAWIGTENPALALSPLVLVLLGWALVAARPHRIALTVFFLAVVVDNPKEIPAEGFWHSPLEPLGVLLYENLNSITGIQALRFSATDLLLAALFVTTVVRKRAPGTVPAPRALHRILALAWVAVVWLEVWGIARGGELKVSLWQLRPLFWAPVIAYVLARDLRGPRDHVAVGKAVVGAAIVKAALGAYYYFVVSRPLGYYPQYATTHSDTILFVAAAVIAIALALERLTLRAIGASIAILVPVLLGILVNGRRLAYVSLAGSAVAIYLMLPAGVIRRTANRVLAASAPLGLVYLAIGWTSDAAIFGPARKVATLFSKDDRSAAMRDIENYNLVYAWRQHLLLGTGFGHEYDELTSPEGAAINYPLYRYIAHNSVLWLENAGGYLGFTAFWLLLATLAYFSARAYRFATRPIDRAAALTALSVVVMFVVQAYGDMGLNSWTAMYFLGMGLAISSKLAVATGAFPWPGRAPAPAR